MLHQHWRGRTSQDFRQDVSPGRMMIDADADHAGRFSLFFSYPGRSAGSDGSGLNLGRALLDPARSIQWRGARWKETGALDFLTN